MSPALSARAAEMLADRRARDAMFGDDREGFGEPAWDMLLDLAARGGEADEHELIVAAVVPAVIAQRYLSWLMSRCLAVRAADEEADERGSLLLTERAKAILTAYLMGHGGR